MKGFTSIKDLDREIFYRLPALDVLNMCRLNKSVIMIFIIENH